MQKFRCILIWRFPSVLLVFTWPLVGELNFRGYLISRFYPTREIRENLMHTKNVFYSIRTLYDSYDGLFVRWTIRVLDFSYHRLFVLWTVRTICKIFSQH